MSNTLQKFKELADSQGGGRYEANWTTNNELRSIIMEHVGGTHDHSGNLRIGQVKKIAEYLDIDTATDLTKSEIMNKIFCATNTIKNNRSHRLARYQDYFYRQELQSIKDYVLYEADK